MAKRITDILLSCLGLVVLSPLFFVISIWVKLDSRGAVLFRGERTGRNGSPFLILKFRSMVEEAPVTGPQITAGDDPRITRTGRFLRRTKLDELPQLINVLRGEMSLVGPRPEVRRYVDMFRDDYDEILTLRPGITDIASIEFREEATLLGESDDPEKLYVEVVLPQKILLAKEYKRRSSVLFDITLMLRTLLAISREQRLADTCAAAVVVLVMAAAALYPDSFISGGFMLGSTRIAPLTLLLPLVVITAAAYIFSHFKRITFGIIDISLFAYFAYFMARNISGTETSGAIKYTTYGLALYYLCYVLVKRQSLYLLVYSIIALAFLSSIYGVFVEYLLQRNVLYRSYMLDVIAESKEGLHRLGSTLGHPVSFGAFLIQALPFCVAAWYTELDSRRRYFGITASLLACLALIFTYSLGSWLSAALMLFAFIIMLSWKNRSRTKKIVVPIMILLILTMSVFWQQMTREFLWRTPMSVNVRNITWNASIDGIKEHPWTGVGLRQGLPEIKSHMDPEWIDLTGLSTPVDNSYLTIMLEEGIIGILLWVTFLALTFITGVKACMRRWNLWPWALASLFSICFVSINALTFDAMLVWSNYIFFWIAAGILRGTSDNSNPETQVAS